MHWTIMACKRAAVLAAIAALAAPAWAEEAGPVLVVPPSKTTLVVAADLPAVCSDRIHAVPPSASSSKPDKPGYYKRSDKSGGYEQLVVERVPAIMADGLPGDAAGRLIAEIPPSPQSRGPRRFVIKPGDAPEGKFGGLRFDAINDTSLEVLEGDTPVLVYNYGVITDEKVPEKDPRRSRACYVHPVWGLNGEVLTDDFPKDHYHHHGIFWTWPHVQIEGTEYDLWANLLPKTGPGIRQQFVAWLCRQAGPLAAVLGVENGWFVGDKKVMIERVWISTYKATADSRALDLDFTWIPVDGPITLWGAPGKSYGGLTVRFAPPSKADEATVVTVPDGPTKEDLKETRLPWADFTSKFALPDGKQVTSGAAVFVPPDHPDFPPTWLTRHYGPLCVGWPGVNSRTFLPGKPIRLRYRIWIHKTAETADELKQAYDAYVASTQVKWAAAKP